MGASHARRLAALCTFAFVLVACGARDEDVEPTNAAEDEDAGEAGAASAPQPNDPAGVVSPSQTSPRTPPLATTASPRATAAPSADRRAAEAAQPLAARTSCVTLLDCQDGLL